MVPSPRKTAQRVLWRGLVPITSGVEGRSSGASAAAHGQIAHLVQEHGALQRIHLRNIRSELGEKRIAQNRRSLFMPAAARVTKQIANVDLKRRRKPFER